MSSSAKSEGQGRTTACDVHLKELATLKAEQVQRIGFRDNMLYVTLLVVGAIASFVFEGLKDDVLPGPRRYALLIVPWICVILGWTYVVNDEKISAIGDYIKRPKGLGDRISALVGGDRGSLLQWETAHTSDDWRLLRKLFQLAVDLTTFVLSGFVAMYVFHRSSGTEPHGPEVRTLMYIEAALLMFLAGWIVKYAGIRRGHAKITSTEAPPPPTLPKGEVEKAPPHTPATRRVGRRR